MTQISQFDRQTVRTLDKAVEAALQTVAQEFGLTLALKGARFSPSDCTVRVEFKTVTQMASATGTVTNIPTGFARDARMFGLPEDCFGKTFKFGATEYTITEINPRRFKFPVSATGPQGGKYKFPADAVLRGLVGVTGASVFANPSKFQIGDRVQWKSPFGNVFGIIDGPAIQGGTEPRYNVLTPKGLLTPDEKNLTLAGTRTENEIMLNINGCYNNLSPENLSCDGEASRAHMGRTGSHLNRMLKALFAEIGRTVSEDEAGKWWWKHHAKTLSPSTETAAAC